MRIITLSALAMLLLMIACKTGEKQSQTAGPVRIETEKFVPPPAISEELSAAAEKRYPGLSKYDIAEGEKLYNGKCGRCHGLPEVESISEDKWPGIMDWMAPKANMDEKQKTQVLNYVLCAADVKKLGK